MAPLFPPRESPYSGATGVIEPGGFLWKLMLQCCCQDGCNCSVAELLCRAPDNHSPDKLKKK